MITKQRMELIIKSPSIATEREIRELAIVYILEVFPEQICMLKSPPTLRSPSHDELPRTAYCNSSGVMGGDDGN